MGGDKECQVAHAIALNSMLSGMYTEGAWEQAFTWFCTYENFYAYVIFHCYKYGIFPYETCAVSYILGCTQKGGTLSCLFSLLLYCDSRFVVAFLQDYRMFFEMFWFNILHTFVMLPSVVVSTPHSR